MTERTLRVAIVGAQKGRVRKAVSLLTEEQDLMISLPLPSNKNSSIHVQYLACVATFDSYQNEKGTTVRYIAKVEYCGDPQQPCDGLSPSSLAPFFDDTDDEDDINDSSPSFPGISGVAIGCGIEAPEEVAMIESFLHTLAGENRDDILIECVAPNQEFTTMKQEMQAYKALDEQEKSNVTSLRTMGPGKMASFASSLAKTIVETAISATASHSSTIDATNTDTRDTIDSIDEQEETEATLPEPLFIDPTKTAYACKTCRTVLFGTVQLQDSPHVPRMHSFSKQQHSCTTCSSLFLQQGLPWMGDISTCVEGRLACPKCTTKIGHWKWAGAQCSCGTWVTPAIQVPLSKVDTIQPCGVLRNDKQEQQQGVNTECLHENGNDDETNQLIE